MVIDDRLVRTQPEFMETLDYLTAQRVEPDAAVKALGLEAKQARTTIAELQLALPGLRQQYFAVAEDDKDEALRAVEEAEDTIHRAENRRDELDRKRLLLEQERCAHQVKLCQEEIAAVMEILLPGLARLCAIQQELERQQSIAKTIPQRIGALEREQDTRNAERAQQVARERQRALSMAERRHTREAFAR